MNPVKNNLVALGSAAVLTVYAAGYLRTKSAADRFAGEENDRRRPVATAEQRPDEGGRGAMATPVATDRSDAPAPAGDTQATPLAAAPAANGKRPAATDSAPRNAPAASSTAASSGLRLLDSAPAPQVVATAPATATPPASGLQGGNGAQIGDTASANAQPPKGQLKDGTYSGWGTSRHGDIEATVEIREGRIVSAAISQCRTRYSCSWIAHLPGQVVARQSPEVDYVSGATQSTNAFYYAVVEALAKAK